MALLGLLLPWKTHPPLTPVLLSWKHHVDLLFGISLFVAVALIGGKRPLWALLPTGLACATKETGFVLLLLLPLI
ncbi:MAG: hypothetical protein QGG10_09345, partial [Arenicellales bacterium]|nr:hypothetical protein [Arenicellales bacterium]